MHQNIRFFALLLNELVRRLKCMFDFLNITVIQIKFNLGNVWGILEAEINTRANSMNTVLIELFNIVSKVISTDPHFPQPIFSLQNLLSFVIKIPEKHLNYIQDIDYFLIYLKMAVQKSVTRYRIEINNQLAPKQEIIEQNFPLPSKSFSISFHNSPYLHPKINLLTSLRSTHLASIQSVLESYKTFTYTLVYQKSFYTADQNLEIIGKNVKVKVLGAQIESLMSFLVEKGIRPKIQRQCFGFTKDFTVKYYLFPNFYQIEESSPQTLQNTITECCKECFQVLNIKQGLDILQKQPKSLTSISQKVKKIKLQMFELHLRNRENNQQSSVKNGSERSMPVRKTSFTQSKPDTLTIKNQKSFEDSYSDRQNKRNKQIRPHWVQEKVCSESSTSKKATPQKSHSNTPEGDRISFLKDRVSRALEKTQQTLSKYDKIRSRK